MTEQEWFTCTDPVAMLHFLKGKIRNRKCRLFACACCRRLWWPLLSDVRSQMAVLAGERYADQWITRRELRAVAEVADQVTHQMRSQGRSGRELEVAEAACYAGDGNSWWSALFVGQRTVEEERLRSCNLLRDIVGPHLYHPVFVNPSCLSWHDAAVVKIAHVIYTEFGFGDLPILADALEEAGCDNADILNHCRLPGEHVRGCWVVDLLLNKS